MLKKTILLLSFLVLSTTLHADIKVIYSTQDTPYFSISIPDTWQVNVGLESDPSTVPQGELPPRIISMLPADESNLWFGAWVPVYLHSLDAAQEYLETLDKFLVENPVLIKSDDVELNTMPTRYFRGKGQREGEAVDFFVMLFELSKENIGIAIYIGEPETTEIHIEQLRGMMKSIAPIRE